MALTPLVRPLTSTGDVLLVWVLLPSCPSALYPQHLTPPGLVRAHAWLAPALMAPAALVNPLTSTGVWLSVFEPVPSSPLAFPPQHLAPPLLVSAQEPNKPALMAPT